MTRSGNVTGMRDVAVSDHTEIVARRIARIWTVTGFAAFTILGMTVGIPHGPDLEPWERLVQVATLGVLFLGGVIALRSEGIGGGIMLVGAVALWGMSALQHQPVVAFLPAVLFLVPAVCFLVAWKRTKSITSLIVLGLTVAIVLAVGGSVAFAAYQRGYGPSHPTSDLPPLPDTPVVWIWSGAVTNSSAVVTTRVDAAQSVELHVASDGSERTVVGTRLAETWRFEIDQLSPLTTYTYYAIVDDVPLPQRSGQFTTFTDEPLSFTVAAASCARVGSNGRVYETIAGLTPSLFISTGDIFYADFVSNAGHFDLAYELSLSQPAQATMFATMPMAYVWDDHDIGRNDANTTTETLPLALAAYKQNVPHYPLVTDDGVYQSFSIGRVLFILLDERSYRDPQSEPDGPNKTMLGVEQLQWLEQRLITGRDEYALTILVSQVPWIADVTPGADHWGGYSYERTRLADFIAENGIDNMMILAGDSHMVAIDDGTNTDYSTTGRASFPLLQAAALDRPGTLKGGPYSEGAYPGGGQFGIIEVRDDGRAVQVLLTGMNWTGDVVVEYEFAVGSS